MAASQELWRDAILPRNATIEEAIHNLDLVGIKIIMVVGKNGQLEGTLTDGDIRRGLLKGLNLNSPITSIIHQKSVLAPLEMDRTLVKQLMIANKIQQIPVVDKNHHVVGLHLWDEILSSPQRLNSMVIMAGGRGRRLLPHTEGCPKPLLPINGKPMLEHIIDRAKLEGFNHFILAIHYLGEMIEDYFGNGQRLGVKVEYLREASPLGTAGALGLFEVMPDLPFVVTNGDVITDVRYGELLDFHLRSNASATMAVRAYEWENPFGVVHTSGIEIVGFEEKPVTKSHINAGIYALNPEALDTLVSGEHCDMPTLFERLQSQAKRIVAYPMHEPWLDVGRPADLDLARSQEK